MSQPFGKDGPTIHSLAEEAERYQLLTGHLLMQAQEARHGIVPFFEFVIREEHNKRRLRIQPHQKIVLEFVMAHDRCVIMLPVGTSKTFLMAGASMYFLGNDVTVRGCIVSATQGQACKPVSMVRDYIDESRELRLVFPHLARGQRGHWTDSSITVDRPPGIRDPSLVAVGLDGAIAGGRFNWILVDDILNRQNTGTLDQRERVYEFFGTSVLSRLDPGDRAKVVVTNTAWHPDDLPHRLRDRQRWPTLRMDVEGGIEISNTRWDPSDPDALRPASNSPGEVMCRLTEHDGPEWQQYARGGQVPLWPGRYPWSEIDKLRNERHLPKEFNQLFMGLCRDDESAACKQEYIDTCLMKGRGLSLVPDYKGPNLTFTGLDLAVSPGEEHDFTAFFTFEQQPTGMKRILDIEFGQWDGPSIVQKLIRKSVSYNSIVTVENNAAQDFIRQFTLKEKADIPVIGFYTGRTKAHPEHGVPGLFTELRNGAWIIPCDHTMRYDHRVKKFIDACLYYSPSRHVDDVLMACYFAREQAKKFGVLDGTTGTGGGLSGILSR